MEHPTTIIVRELQARLGPRVPVVALPSVDRFATLILIRIGENPFTQYTWSEGQEFTPEIADRWCQEYFRNRDVARGVEAVRYTYQVDPAQWVAINTPITVEGVGMPVTITLNETATTTTNSPQVRTPEQEARFQTLEAEARQRIFSNAELDERQRLGRMAPCPTVPVPAPRIRVRVARDSYGSWLISVKVGNTQKELPKVAVIKALLPPGEKHFIPNRQGRYRPSSNILATALSAGLSAQSLHDALKAWVIASETQATNVESDTPLIDNSQIELLRAQPATLEVGGKVYKLVPCGEIDVRPLITRVRTKALASARVEGEIIKTRATTDARLVVSQAEQSAQAMRAAIAQERAGLGNPIPEWVKVSGRSHKWDGSNWNVQLMISCKVDKIRLMVSAWEMILWWNSLHPRDDNWYQEHKMPVWLRLHPEGAYSLSDVSMKGEWETTHIASYCCMELQGLPPAITSNDLATRLENGLSRGMRVINLNSPLGAQTFKYWPDFKAQIPLVPLRFLEQGRNSERYINPGRVGIENWKAANPSITWDREESTRAEADGVFTVQPEVRGA